MNVIQQLRTASILLLLMTVLTGLIYPGIVTYTAQMAFPHQANGSLIRNGENLVGSELIGQTFTKPEYFWGRLSATAPVAYNAAASSGSNYGPLNPALVAAVESRLAALKESGSPTDNVPVDLVTASGSGLDPQISIAAAEFQVSRVAKARGMNDDSVRQLIRQHTAHRQFGVLGEPCVNVLKLNLALDLGQKTN